jgi:hypothetical protein
MIRVFPVRTSFTPKDELAFIGEPPLIGAPPKHLPVRISCAFTWLLEESERLVRSWCAAGYEDVEAGGPAYGDAGGEFVPGRFVRHGITITSRGCTKSCSWCFVPKREGWIRELEIHPGHIVQDNNLLACRRDHIERVFDMLRGQRAIQFTGGIDIELLQDWHVPLFQGISLENLFVAYDYPGAYENLERAAELLSVLRRRHRHCYVMIGYEGDTLSAAARRLEQAYDLGFLPAASLYRPEDSLRKKHIDPAWNDLAATWMRPARYKAMMKTQREAA